jgi:hypothetical protein
LFSPFFPLSFRHNYTVPVFANLLPWTDDDLEEEAIIFSTSSRAAHRRPVLERVGPEIFSQAISSTELLDALPLSALRINYPVRDGDYILINLISKRDFDPFTGEDLTIGGEDPPEVKTFLGAVSAKKASRRGHVLASQFKLFARKMVATHLSANCSIAIMYSLVVDGQIIDSVSSPWFRPALPAYGT